METLTPILQTTDILVGSTNKKNECSELKNIKYKTMLINGLAASSEIKAENDLVNLDKFLEDNKTINQNDQWSKLDKTVKTKKLLVYAEKYAASKEFSKEEEELLASFLKDCLDRKRFQRVKDVEYDKITGEITDIPALTYLKSTKHFTLKNVEKRVSTLKSLPPKKVKGTIKNTHKAITIGENIDEVTTGDNNV
jgi:hypothetical protein